jgi:RNA polymerase sigma factor (sigma-70 family)
LATDEKTLRRRPSAPQGALALLGSALPDADQLSKSFGPAAERTAEARVSLHERQASSDQVDRLFRSQGPQLLRFLSRRTAHREDAADLLQEAFLRLIRLVSLTPFPEHPEAYLQQIVGNLLRDGSRRRASRSDALHEPLDAHPIVDPAAGPADLLEAHEMLRAYETCLLKLPPKTRQIFLLHRRDGLTYAQIAAETGLSVSGVEKHMMKAIAHLDRELGRP